jgi:hypothetical protein
MKRDITELFCFVDNFAKDIEAFASLGNHPSTL